MRPFALEFGEIKNGLINTTRVQLQGVFVSLFVGLFMKKKGNVETKNFKAKLKTKLQEIDKKRNTDNLGFACCLM